jgi:ubiquinone/menaquinone biosynthesis C-methylase UbiE
MEGLLSILNGWQVFEFENMKFYPDLFKSVKTNVKMNDDKQIEQLRYDEKAKSLLDTGSAADATTVSVGSLASPPAIRKPYTYYENCISQFICPDNDVLELGSGTGLHTSALMQTGAKVVASDISPNSLKVIMRRIEGVRTQVADMEDLPFKNDSFDVVTSAGSLSYGDPDTVDAEVRRVLRPGGIFICVDSLNHNPVYRFNRWLHSLQGERTKSTLLRMPTISRIQSISSGYKDTEVRYFGTVSYLMPFLAGIIGQNQAAKVSDAVDRMVHVRRSAFKFVLVARGRL